MALAGDSGLRHTCCPAYLRNILPFTQQIHRLFEIHELLQKYLLAFHPNFGLGAHGRGHDRDLNCRN